MPLTCPLPLFSLGFIPPWFDLKERNRREKKEKKVGQNKEEGDPSHPLSPTTIQLCFFPHRTSVSLTTTFVGKLAQPPTRRTAPLAGRAAHGGARAAQRRRTGIKHQNHLLNCSPSTLNQNERDKLRLNQEEEPVTLVAATSGATRRSGGGDGGGSRPKRRSSFHELHATAEHETTSIRTRRSSGRV